jgi:RNA polymerase sigma factor (sigma-70 family)
MSETPAEFADLMNRVRQGSEEAARTVVERYGSHIRRVVRRRLSPSLRPQFDSLDFEQSVWASFFASPRERYKFETADDLIGFLARVAHHKVIETFRARTGPKRDVNRETRLGLGPDDGPQPETPRTDSPSKAAMANEQWERLLAHAPVKYHPVLEMLRQGYGHKEIAEQLGFHPKAVQRLVQRLFVEVQSP